MSDKRYIEIKEAKKRMILPKDAVLHFPGSVAFSSLKVNNDLKPATNAATKKQNSAAHLMDRFCRIYDTLDTLTEHFKFEQKPTFARNETNLTPWKIPGLIRDELTTVNVSRVVEIATIDESAVKAKLPRSISKKVRVKTSNKSI
jgi:hypothetical protein